MKQLRYCQLWAFALVCLVVLRSPAQSTTSQSEAITKLLPKPVPNTPNVAALGKFGEYQVNAYTGLPEISIPLYEVKNGELSVPITLQYHASGIRRSDDASWVGLGWSLSCGGQVSRKLQGLADEDNYTTTPLQLNLSNCNTYSYLWGCSKNVKDAQPDLFSYTFPGSSGSFFLGSNGAAPYMFPYSANKIQTYNPNDKFEIINEHGQLFRFGKNSDGVVAMDYSQLTADNAGLASRPTAWHLMEMIAPNSDDKISFSYQSLGFTTKSETMHTIVVKDPCSEYCYHLGSCGTSVESMINSVISSYDSRGLNEVTYPGGKVMFIANTLRTDLTGLKMLDEIRIYSETGGVYSVNPIKTFRFVYSYFSGASRLKLDELQELDANGGVVKQYRFTYETNSLVFGNGIDYWGFGNGITSNSTLIPVTTITFDGDPNFQIGGANRNPDSTFMKQGVLKKIQHPTGGYTEFMYECHQYDDEGVYKIAGGLRIKKITNTTGVPTEPPVIKYYKYGVNENGKGVKCFNLNFNNFKSVSAFKNMYSEGLISCMQTWTVTTYMSNALYGMGNVDGSAVVYPVVTEYLGYPLDNNGKTVYEFDYGQYGNNDFTYMLPWSSTTYTDNIGWKRGKLTKKSVFDRGGNPVTMTEIAYEEIKGESRWVGTIVANKINYVALYTANGNNVAFCENEFGDWVDPDEFAFQHYSQTSGILKEKTIKETVYQSGSTASKLIKLVTNIYNADHLQVQSRSEENSTQPEVYWTKFQYPFNFSPSSSDTGAPLAIKLLNDKHILTTPIEQYSYFVNGANTSYTGGQITKFKRSTVNPSYVHPDEIFILENTDVLSSYAPVSLTSSDYTMHSAYKSRIKYLSFDRYGNVESVQRTNDAPISYLWGYHDSFPIAEIVNSTVDRVYSPTTYFFGTSITTNQGADVALSPALTIDYHQTVNYSINFFLQGGSPTLPPTLDIVLKSSSGSVVYDPSIYQFGVYSAVLTLPPDTYTFYYRGQANSSTIRFNITVDYVQTSSYPKVFYSSFEESGIVDANSKTGTRVHSGQYSVRVPSYSGTYVVSWWQKPTSSGTWTFNRQILNVPYSNSFYTIGATGQFVDEVRLYPVTSQMKTYCFTPEIGMTATGDENSKVTYFEYDTSGRLMFLRDLNKKIVKMYQYHYKD